MADTQAMKGDASDDGFYRHRELLGSPDKGINSIVYQICEASLRVSPAKRPI